MSYTDPRLSQYERQVGEQQAAANGSRPGRVVEPARSNSPEWGDAYPFPRLNPAALYGIAGAFVKVVAPHSEASLASLISQFLTLAGCALGADPHLYVEGTRHTARVNVLLVGDTSVGRKGTSLDRALQPFVLADEGWIDSAIISGLGSGEALLSAFKDADAGTPAEKRRVVKEPEFARVLDACNREGSTLSSIIRDAWDTGNLQHRLSGRTTIVSGAHVVIIGHITGPELREKLSAVSITNGFLNRFMLISVKRRKGSPSAAPSATTTFCRSPGACTAR